MEWIKHDNGIYTVEYAPGNGKVYRLQLTPDIFSPYPNSYLLTWTNPTPVRTHRSNLYFEVFDHDLDRFAKVMDVDQSDARPIADAYNALVRQLQEVK